MLPVLLARVPRVSYGQPRCLMAGQAVASSATVSRCRGDDPRVRLLIGRRVFASLLGEVAKNASSRFRKTRVVELGRGSSNRDDWHGLARVCGSGKPAGNGEQ